MNDWVVQANHLRAEFRPTRAVDGVSLAVAPGQAYGLVGPDGAGKTTTMRLLVGALHARRRGCTHHGPGLATAGAAALLQVGYLPQRFSLYIELTVQENLDFFGTERGVVGSDLRTRSAELLRFVGLTGFERAPGGAALGWHEAEVGVGLRPDPSSPPAASRRAHGWRGSGDPPGFLEADHSSARRWRGGCGEYTLYGRSCALQSDRVHARRAHHDPKVRRAN